MAVRLDGWESCGRFQGATFTSFDGSSVVRHTLRPRPELGMRNRVRGGGERRPWVGGDTPSDKAAVNGADGEGAGEEKKAKEWLVSRPPSDRQFPAPRALVEGTVSWPSDGGEVGISKTAALFPSGTHPSGAGGADLAGGMDEAPRRSKGVARKMCSGAEMLRGCAAQSQLLANWPFACA